MKPQRDGNKRRTSRGTESTAASSHSGSSVRPSPRIQALAEHFERRAVATGESQGHASSSKVKAGTQDKSGSSQRVLKAPPSHGVRKADPLGDGRHLESSGAGDKAPDKDHTTAKTVPQVDTARKSICRPPSRAHSLSRAPSPAPSYASSLTAYDIDDEDDRKSKTSAFTQKIEGKKIDGIPSLAKAEAQGLKDVLKYIPDDHIEASASTSRLATSRGKQVDNGGRTSGTASMQTGVAVQASKVFSPNAFPLHLPRLDDYLALESLFCVPRFSDPRQLCSQEEADLFRYDEPESARRIKMEIAGSQLAIPPPPPTSRGKLRKRRKSTTSATNVVSNRDSASDPVHSLSYDGRMDDDRERRPDKTDDSHLEKITSVLPQSQGLASKLSTSEHPKTRLSMFPPLMLLRDNSLNELKSNAVGPRKAPGGFLGALPGIGSILGTIIDFLIGVEGSTFAAGIFRLQVFIDFVQMMDLNLHFVNATHINTPTQSLKMVSSFVSVDYVSVFGFAIVILFVMMGIVAVLLVVFWNLTRTYNPNRTLEGYASQPWLFRLIPRAKAKGDDGVPQLRRSTAWSKAGHVLLIMTLTVLYIPLSKLCMDALVWSIDYWPDAKAPSAIPTDTSIETRFCYRTNIDDSTFNWAYLVVSAAAITLLVYTLWFPWQMRRMIKQYIPRISANNELGLKRSKQMLDTEYVRELERDRAPFNFMYNAYRRRYGDYKPLYLLCFKLTTLLVISIVTQQNCLFQHIPQQKMLIAQQSVLIGLHAILLGAHLQTQPFVDLVSNRSELVSRIGYTVTSTLGLVTALTYKRRTVVETITLYAVECITYGFNIYLTIIGTAWMSHLIKRAQRRIDFSIDVFSPFIHLDKHIKRRIWQETLSTVLLCGPEYRMPIEQSVMFSLDDGWPPYLVLFQHSAAERHIENLKILKYVGIDEYKRHAAQLDRGDPESVKTRQILKLIQLDFTGADAYWQPDILDGQLKPVAMDGVTSWFGKAFFVPFPPTVVIRYDQSVHGLRGKSTIQITTPAEFDEYLRQNMCDDVQSRRWVRHALRALDGQPVFCPHVQHTRQGNNSSILSALRLSSLEKGYHSLARPVYYDHGILHVRRRMSSGLGETPDREAGFDVTITYTSGQRQDPEGVTVVKEAITIDASSAFGLRFDFAYTPSVREFIDANSATVRLRMPQIQARAQKARESLYQEMRCKEAKLSYTFLPNVFDHPVRSLAEVEALFQATSSCREVRLLPTLYPATTRLLIERIDHITRSRVHQWWYLFWDDLWRQNSLDFVCLRRHRTTFNPMYPSSIAYTPMPRVRLVEMLKSKRGIWIRDTHHQRHKALQSIKGFRDRGLFDEGLVNRIYFLLDEVAFDKSSSCNKSKVHIRGDDIRLGARESGGSVIPQGLDDIEMAGHSSGCIERVHEDDAPGSQHTGGGTNENDTHIIERGAWGWTEQRLAGRRTHSLWRHARERILEWLSIQPYKLNDNIAPLYIYLRLVDGHYETALPPPRAPSTVLHDERSTRS